MTGRRCAVGAALVSLSHLGLATVRAEDTELEGVVERVVGIDPLTRAAAPAWTALIVGLATLFLFTFFFQESPPALAQRRRAQRRKYEELLTVVLQDVASKDAEAAATGEEAQGLPEASRIFNLLWDDISEVRTSSYGIEAQGSLMKAAEELLRRLLATELGETIAKTRDALHRARSAALKLADYSSNSGNSSDSDCSGDSEEAEYRSGERLRCKVTFARESVVRRLGADFVQPAQLREAEQLLDLVAREQRKNLQVLLRLLRSVLAPLLVSAPCLMLAEGLQSVYYQIGRWQRVGDAAMAGDEQQILYGLLDLALGHLLIWFFEIIADGYRNRAASLFAQNVRTAVMRALVHQDFEYFDKNSAGTLQERLNRDAEELGSNFIQLPQELLAKVACIAFTLFQVALVCPRDMFLLALLPLPLSAYLHYRLEKVSKSTRSRGRKLGEDAAAATAEVLKEIRTVRQFANERRETYLFGQRELLRNRAREGSAMADCLTGKVFGVIIVSGLLFTEYIGARHVRAGRLTPGLLFDITIKLNFWVVMRVRDLLSMLPRLCTALEPLGRVCELIRTDAKIEDSGSLSPLTVPTLAALVAVLEKCESLGDPASTPTGERRSSTVVREELALDNGAMAARGAVLAAYEVAGEERAVHGKTWLLEQPDLAFPVRLLFSSTRIPLRFEGHIEFDHVVFRYPTDLRKEVLSGLSFSVRPREKVALVGEAGCGKSSCMGLLQRLYDPLEGCIRIDGIPLTEYNVNFLRSRVVIVDQKPVLFATSVRDNVTYGLQREVSDEEVVQVLREASLWAGDNGIESKPDQLLTKLGSGGVALSGGQTQRVSIARAMIRDPDVILLDEATSALDNKNEKIVQEALDRLARRGSALVIAHRLTTIRDADRIIVMRKGRLAEEGTHEELLRLPVIKETKGAGEGEEVIQGIYRHLWELQFRSETQTEAEAEAASQSSSEADTEVPQEEISSLDGA